MDRTTSFKITAALGIFILLLIAAFFIYIYSGAYDIAATDPHTDFTQWTLNTLMVNSVEARAEPAEVEVPALSDSSMIAAGFQAFSEMCVVCHGAPGVEPSYIGKGLRPDAPELSEVAEFWSPAEVFWIVKHGIKMTGMPAFGVTHSDEQLWEVVAFVRQLPDISPAEYAALQATATGEASGHEHTHDGGTGGSQGHEHSH